MDDFRLCCLLLSDFFSSTASRSVGRMTQLYSEGGVLYIYIAVCTAGLAPEKALEAFEHLEHAARRAVLAFGSVLPRGAGDGE